MPNSTFRPEPASLPRAAYRGWWPVAAACVLAIGVTCAQAQTPPAAGEVHESGGHRFRLVPVADGLQNPWSIAFLPGGDILVTERGSQGAGPAQLRAIRGGTLQP